MKRLLIYADTSAIGGCEDREFSADSRALWEEFAQGSHTLVLSAHTPRELQRAPDPVRARIQEVPVGNQVMVADSQEAEELAAAYLRSGICRAWFSCDALHVALATIGRADVLVSWNFKHMVNLGRIRLFESVNIEQGYPVLEIRTPREVLFYEREF